jgi:hypothetical protein
VVFLGTVNQNQDITPTGTGFVTIIKDIFHLVTAKHVILNRETDTLIDNEMYIFFNNLDGTIGAARIHDIKNKFNTNWIFHENSSVDMGLFPLVSICQITI